MDAETLHGLWEEYGTGQDHELITEHQTQQQQLNILP